MLLKISLVLAILVGAATIVFTGNVKTKIARGFRPPCEGQRQRGDRKDDRTSRPDEIARH